MPTISKPAWRVSRSIQITSTEGSPRFSTSLAQMRMTPGIVLFSRCRTADSAAPKTTSTDMPSETHKRLSCHLARTSQDANCSHLLHARPVFFQKAHDAVLDLLLLDFWGIVVKVHLLFSGPFAIIYSTRCIRSCKHSCATACDDGAHTPDSTEGRSLRKVCREER
jgi:hypothetical protein